MPLIWCYCECEYEFEDYDHHYADRFVDGVDYIVDVVIISIIPIFIWKFEGKLCLHLLDSFYSELARQRNVLLEGL